MVERSTAAAGNPTGSGSSSLIGKPLRRVEDERLLRGNGRYVADLQVPGTLTAVFVRSSHAHAKVVNIDAAAAREMPGVVAVFTVAGVFGLYFLLQTLEKLSRLPRYEEEPAPPPPVASEPAEAAPAEAPPGLVLARPVAPPPSPVNSVRTVFWIWLVVFALVGAQMSWVLRPFIGSPDREFTWFRPRESNFFQAVYDSIYYMLHGG